MTKLWAIMRGLSPSLVFDRNRIFLFRPITIFGKNGILADNIGQNAEYRLFRPVLYRHIRQNWYFGRWYRQAPNIGRTLYSLGSSKRWGTLSGPDMTMGSTSNLPLPPFQPSRWQSEVKSLLIGSPMTLGPNSIEKLSLQFWLEKLLEFLLEIPYTKQMFKKMCMSQNQNGISICFSSRN